MSSHQLCRAVTTFHPAHLKAEFLKKEQTVCISPWTIGLCVWILSEYLLNIEPCFIVLEDTEILLLDLLKVVPKHTAEAVTDYGHTLSV